MERLYVKWGMLIPFLALTLTSSSARAQSLPQWGTIFAPSAPNQTTDIAVAAPRLLGPAAAANVALTGRVDHVANGVGLRNLGSGTIRLRGVPATASAELGILYFGVICSGPCPASQVVNFQGNAVAAIRIASASQPCWFGTEYGAYSVDVTPLLSGSINDDYFVDSVPSNLKDGTDPWVSPGITAPLAEGASLVVIYSDPSLSPGVVYVNEGAMFFAGTVNIDNPVAPPLLGSFRRFTAIGADGQVGVSESASPAKYVHRADRRPLNRNRWARLDPEPG